MWRKLRQADVRYNGTAAVGPQGPAETHLASFHLVPIVGVYFGEGNAELMDLIKRIARVLSASKWRQPGFKGPKGGVAPAEAGIARRVGLALDRANAQRVAGDVDLDVQRDHDAQDFTGGGAVRAGAAA